MPAGWKRRLIVIDNANARGARGLCLEIHDLLVSKAIAGRDKDLAFLRAAARGGLVSQAILLERLDTVAVDDAVKRIARTAIERAF